MRTIDFINRNIMVYDHRAHCKRFTFIKNKIMNVAFGADPYMCPDMDRPWACSHFKIKCERILNVLYTYEQIDNEIELV